MVAYCNVKLVQEKGDPQTAIGIQRIPPGATLQQMINIVNNNIYILSKGNFVENGRQSEITRIYNPADPSQFVDVRQIIGLNFVNPLTKQTLSFRR